MHDLTTVEVDEEEVVVGAPVAGLLGDDLAPVG